MWSECSSGGMGHQPKSGPEQRKTEKTEKIEKNIRGFYNKHTITKTPYREYSNRWDHCSGHLVDKRHRSTGSDSSMCCSSIGRFCILWLCATSNPYRTTGLVSLACTLEDRVNSWYCVASL